MKTCTNCNTSYPATAEYFYKDKRYRNGLLSWCKICKREYTKEYRGKNKEKWRVYYQKWQKDNSQSRAKSYRKWRGKNKEKRVGYYREWVKNNPDNIRARTARRRANKVAAQGTHTEKDIQRLKCLQDHRCLYCNCTLTKCTTDHFIPLSKSGRNSSDNLAITCPTCNFSKRANLPWEWIGWNGAYPVEWEEEKIHASIRN